MSRNFSSSDGTNDTLTRTAIDTLRRMILSGELRGGTTIQERRMAGLLGLSRTPIRAALGHLEGEGYLRRDGRVIFVDSIAAEEVMEILSVRRLLEVEAAKLAAGRISSERLSQIRDAINSMKDRDHTDPEHHWTVDDMVHLSIAEAAGNRLLIRMLEDLRKRTRMFGLARVPNRFEPGKQEHLRILDAIESGDGAAAAEAMDAHLCHARDGIVRTLTEGRRW